MEPIDEKKEAAAATVLALKRIVSQRLCGEISAAAFRAERIRLLECIQALRRDGRRAGSGPGLAGR